MSLLSAVFSSAIYTTACAPFLYAGSLIRSVEPRNNASLLVFCSFLIAIAFGLSGNMISGYNAGNVIWEFFATMFFALVGVGFTWLSFVNNDKIILDKIDNNKAIKDGNMSVAIVESAGVLATGFILFTSMMGEGGFLDLVLFFILGQLVISASSKLAEYFGLVNQQYIETGSIGEALIWGAKILSVGMVSAAALIGNSGGLGQDIFFFVFYSTFGFAILSMLDKTSEVIIEKYVSEEWDYNAISAVEAAVTIVIGLLVAASIV